MTRILAAACAAAALGFTMPLAAQTATTTPTKTADQKEMTLTGCLEKNQSGGFWLTNAAMESGSSRSATETAGTTGTTSAKAADATSSHTWNLENGHDLDRYVGQKVQVSGHAKNDTSGDKLKGTTSKHETQARDFEVQSVKMIAASCR